MSEWRTSDDILDSVTVGTVDELRGIDLGMLRADAEALRVVVEQAENHRHNLSWHWTKLSGWDGAAALAARAHRDRLDAMTSRFLLDAARAPGAILAAVTAIQDALLAFVAHAADLADVDEADLRQHAFDEYTRLAAEEIQRHYDLMLANLRPLTQDAFADSALPSTSDTQPMTIRHADSTVSLSTLDGRIRLIVADPAGAPRTYDLDLGTTPSGDVTGGPATPQPETGGASGAPSAPKLPPTLFPWTTTKRIEKLRPDEDRRVVIRDDKVLITVESDDHCDELTITLDDGLGNRTSYRVDYADPANPTLRPA